MPRFATLAALSLVAFVVVIDVAGCAPPTKVAKTCVVVTDCDVGQACVGGSCVGGDEGEGEGAAEGEGTGEGEGEGTEGGGEGEGESSCSTDADCGRGEICAGGVCVNITTSDGCHNDAECTGGAFCVSPDAPPQCGAPPAPPPPGCTSNGDCGAEVCDFTADGCGGGFDQCVPACASDADCRAGEETCNAGRCETIPCTNASQFVCPSWTACGGVAPDPLADDSLHGCVPISCTADQDCPAPIGGFVAIAPAGFCVQGACASGPGQCEVAVP